MSRRFVSRRPKTMSWYYAGGTPTIVTASDTFERADANPMSTTMSDGISIWVSGPGGFSDCQINSGVLNRVITTSGATVSSPSFGASQLAKIVFAGTPNGCGVMCRMPPSSSAGYLLYASANVTLQLYHRTDAGVLTQIGSNINITAIGAGDSISLKVTGTGVGTITFEMYRNDVSIGTRTFATDPSPYNSGQPGLYISGLNGIASFSATEV